jgi:hypothetical protein
MAPKLDEPGVYSALWDSSDWDSSLCFEREGRVPLEAADLDFSNPLCTVLVLVLVIVEAAGSIPYMAGEAAARLLVGFFQLLISLVVPNVSFIASSLAPLAYHVLGGVGCAIAFTLDSILGCWDLMYSSALGVQGWSYRGVDVLSGGTPTFEGASLFVAWAWCGITGVFFWVGVCLVSILRWSWGGLVGIVI